MHSAMEQSRCWMWSRRKLSSGRPHDLTTGTSYNDSWEEQAFAEDSAGRLGGCTWPPRSYSCSFCRREFRSAQALGGHMNVHRRDRARLKQSPNENNHHHPQQHHQVCTQLVYNNNNNNNNNNPNPKPNSNPGVVASSPLSPSRVSAASTLVSPPYTSSFIQEHRKRSIKFSTTPRSHSDPFSLQILTVPGLKLGTEDLKLKEMGFRGKRDAGEEKEEEAISSKRRRTTDASIPFFVRPPSGDRGHLQSDQLLGLGPSPIEELDLELRLGDRPKVAK